MGSETGWSRTESPLRSHLLSLGTEPELLERLSEGVSGMAFCVVRVTDIYERICTCAHVCVCVNACVEFREPFDVR